MRQQGREEIDACRAGSTTSQGFKSERGVHLLFGEILPPLDGHRSDGKHYRCHCHATGSQPHQRSTASRGYSRRLMRVLQVAAIAVPALAIPTGPARDALAPMLAEAGARREKAARLDDARPPLLHVAVMQSGRSPLHARADVTASVPLTLTSRRSQAVGDAAGSKSAPPQARASTPHSTAARDTEPAWAARWSRALKIKDGDRRQHWGLEEGWRDVALWSTGRP